MILPCVLIVLISFSVIDNVNCQMPDIPMPPIPPMPGFIDSRVRRSAQAPAPPAPPSPSMALEPEQRVRRSAQAPPPDMPAPPSPPMPFETVERNRRSAPAALSSGFKKMNVGEIASSFYGIRNKREARGGRMPTTNG